VGLLAYANNDKNSSSSLLTLCDKLGVDTFANLVTLDAIVLVYPFQPSPNDTSNHPLFCL